MRIKIFIIGFLLLAGPRLLLAQLKVEGEWELDKVKVRLVTDQGNNLLEENTWDTLPQKVTLVGRSISFSGQQYLMQTTQGTERGSFLLLSDGSIAFRSLNRLPAPAGVQQPQQPDIFCKANMPDVDKLTITLPVEVYKDHARNLIVKQSIICQYNRKK